MTIRLSVGDFVTVQGPFVDDPILVGLQPHARVAVVLPPAADESQYLVELLSASPGLRFGPFPAERLKPWRGCGWGC